MLFRSALFNTLIIFCVIVALFFQSKATILAKTTSHGFIAQTACNQSCSPAITGSCGTGLTCVAVASPCSPGLSCPQTGQITEYRCRNNSCQNETDCTCGATSNTPTPTPIVEKLVCGETCEVNSDCQSGYCYQYVCPPGISCPNVVQPKTCRNILCPNSSTCNCATPTPTPVVVATPTPVPSPTLFACNQQCLSDDQCQTGFCYQPPAPTCPPGLMCTQSLPFKVCRLESNPASTTCAGSLPTPTPSGIPDQTVICRADLNQDTIVDLSDYSFMIADFFKTVANGANPRNDYSLDGIVDISDWNIFKPILLANFFSRCEGGLSAPTN